MSKPRPHADGRPRVHIWPDSRGGFAWSRGACGLRHHVQDFAIAANDARQAVGDQPFLIIVEPVQ